MHGLFSPTVWEFPTVSQSLENKFSAGRGLSQAHGQSPAEDICQILKLHVTGKQQVS